jgi:hypothetical protein
MASDRQLILFPMQLHQNDILTIQAVKGHFDESAYSITNEAGRIIRKGAVSSNLAEFKLRLVGLQAGVYRFVMGQQQEKFVVI